jgi:hypothetical protein
MGREIESRADLLLEGDDEEVDELDFVAQDSNQALDRFLLLDLERQHLNPIAHEGSFLNGLTGKIHAWLESRIYLSSKIVPKLKVSANSPIKTALWSSIVHKCCVVSFYNAFVVICD